MSPNSFSAIRVTQPFGEFFLASLPAGLLLKVAFSDPLRAKKQGAGEPYKVAGLQRRERDDRVREISKFIRTQEATFPTPIILAANYSASGRVVEDDDVRWQVSGKDGRYTLEIPTEQPMASIVDGQHRLLGFGALDDRMPGMELPCSIFFDLPNPLQAYVFATVNFNQKRVDRSLAYEDFSFDTDDEPASAWFPEKLAVFLCRRLTVDPESPFVKRIRISPIHGEELDAGDWGVSTAAIVDGILRLISKHPHEDRVALLTEVRGKRQRKSLSGDGTPLRKAFLESNDLLVYTVVKNFFGAAKDLLWSNAGATSYLKRTVGIQALFDLLLVFCQASIEAGDISAKYFESRLRGLSAVDFADDFFQASGKGRVRLRNAMMDLLDLGSDAIPAEGEEHDKYMAFLARARLASGRV